MPYPKEAVEPVARKIFERSRHKPRKLHGVTGARHWEELSPYDREHFIYTAEAVLEIAAKYFLHWR